MLKEGTIPVVDQPLIQAVKYALDQLGITPGTQQKPKRRNSLEHNAGVESYIIAINETDKEIPARSFVTITHRFDSTAGRNVYCIKPGNQDPCGWACSKCLPGEQCKVQVSGVVSYADMSNMDRSIPTPNFLNFDGPILLNSTGQSTYNNYFKVVATEWGSEGRIKKVRVCDGGDLYSIHAGFTDVGMVYAEDINGDFWDGCGVFIKLNTTDQNGDNRYTHEFFVTDVGLTDIDTEKLPVILLAEIVRGKVIQRWTGGKIHWRDRFVLPMSIRRPT